MKKRNWFTSMTSTARDFIDRLTTHSYIKIQSNDKIIHHLYGYHETIFIGSGMNLTDHPFTSLSLAKRHPLVLKFVDKGSVEVFFFCKRCGYKEHVHLISPHYHEFQCDCSKKLHGKNGSYYAIRLKEIDSKTLSSETSLFEDEKN